MGSNVGNSVAGWQPSAAAKRAVMGSDARLYPPSRTLSVARGMSDCSATSVMERPARVVMSSHAGRLILCPLGLAMGVDVNQRLATLSSVTIRNVKGPGRRSYVGVIPGPMLGNVAKYRWTFLNESATLPLMPSVDRHLAGAIEARRKELGLDVQALVDLTGLTRQGLQPLLRGERKRYQDRLKLPLCQALDWTPDSIDRLLAGLEPIIRPGAVEPAGLPEFRLSAVAEMERQADQIEQLQRATHDEVDGLHAELEAHLVEIRALQTDVDALRLRVEALEQPGRESV